MFAGRREPTDFLTAGGSASLRALGPNLSPAHYRRLIVTITPSGQRAWPDCRSMQPAGRRGR
jgi:hypothetical protein